MQSFWYHRPEANHPPPLIHSPDQIERTARLAVAPGTADLSASRQRALVREWCSILPTLSGIRLLWITGRVSQALFDAACQVDGLEGLWIKASRINTLQALPTAGALQYFHLGSSPSLESTAPLRSCRGLKVLGLENIKRISALDDLEVLTSLDQLTVGGSMWTTQRVATLGPLGTLSELRYLSLINLRAADKTLRPLFNLRKLVRFFTAQWWDTAELEQLRALNPNLLDNRTDGNLAS